MDKQTRQDYDDVYRAMGNDSNARKRLEGRGLLSADAKLVDLYRLGAKLADKLTSAGDRYVEISANRAEKELGRLTSMRTCNMYADADKFERERATNYLSREAAELVKREAR